MTYEQHIEMLCLASSCLAGGLKRLSECDVKDRTRIEKAVQLDYENLCAEYRDHAVWAKNADA